MSTTTLTSNDLTLCFGVGNLEHEEACVMAAAYYDWHFKRGIIVTKLSDNLDCACPILQTLLIHINDSIESCEERESLLRPWVTKIQDSRVDSQTTLKRLRRLESHTGVDYIRAEAETSEQLVSTSKEFSRHIRRLAWVVVYRLSVAEALTLAEECIKII